MAPARPHPPVRPLLVIGHRGAPGYRPEHTRAAYDLALAQGADAVEPDVVFTRDGVAVVRHENEIGSTTDVAHHAAFADRRTTRLIDGEPVTGWFTEDFTWDELATLRCRERLPFLRPGSAAHDGEEPPLRLRDVLDLVREAAARRGSDIAVVVEVKHAAHFVALGFDVADLLVAELAAAGWADGRLPLIVESFEPTILARLRSRGLPARYVFLLEAEGHPADLVARDGAAAPTYRSYAEPDALADLARQVDGISVDVLTLLPALVGASAPEASSRARTDWPRTLVEDAHRCGLEVFTWTLRPENAFLPPAARRGSDPAAFGDYRTLWRAVAATGVDGVFADHPDLAVAALR